MAKIYFETSELKGREQTLPPAGITLGRSPRCNLVLNDKLVSGEHAAFRMENGAWWLYDLNSSNGTEVNGENVKGVALCDGDVIQLGDIKLIFRANGTAETSSSDIISGVNMTPGSNDGFAGKTTETVAVPAVSQDEKKVEEKAPKTETIPSKNKKIDSKIIPAHDDLAMIEELGDAYKRMKEQLGRVIIGQSAVIDEVLMALLSRGHALLIGVPGLAKTLLISTLSHVLDLSFKRIQFTPDLMPGDITGTDVLEEDRSTGQRGFRFVRGPIFANMLLADEINRTPPKTQSALLEAMQEHRVTVGVESYHLPEPFFVLATQNPIEQEGTYPLPEAQLDRFMFNIVVDYPTAEEESQIIRQVTGSATSQLQVTMDAAQVLKLQQLVRQVPVSDLVIDYARDLTRATRPKYEEAPDFVKEMVGWGAGPRAGICLVTAAKARAILNGRHHATTADVSAVALPVLRHRVITTFNAEAAGMTSDEIVRMLLERLRPREDIKI